MNPFHAEGQKGTWSLVPLFGLQPNRKGTSIQSTALCGGMLYVFYHDSILQRYHDGKLVSEDVVRGDLYHANDTELDGPYFIQVDTGRESPSLCRFDRSSNSVTQRWLLHTPGFRTASCAWSKEGTLLLVLVQTIALDQRTAMTVAEFDFEKGVVKPLFTLPQHHRFVQGCAVRGDDLFITSNDGGDSATTRFIDYDLHSGKVVDDVCFSGFGESEGLYRGEGNQLITGLNLRHGRSAVYRLVAPGEAV